MQPAIPLVAALLVLTVLAPLAAAHHFDDIVAIGVGVDEVTGAVFKARVQTFGFYQSATVRLTDVATGQVTSASFSVVLTQNGIDPDPVPEAMVRTITGIGTPHDFVVQGGMAQWETGFTEFNHAYAGHFDGVQLALVAFAVNGVFVDA
jgi:hypothetical protein